MNPSDDALFRHDGDSFARADDDRVGLLVADSFLIHDGNMLAPDLHRERFAAGCAEVGVDRSDAAQFWDAALEAIPPIERWFPRIELAGVAEDPVFQVRVRLAPPLSDVVRVRSHRGDDPRTVPHRKGPDIEALLEARRESGADEAIIVSADGMIIDGTTSAVLWWRGDSLRTVPSRRPRVDSVTARAVGMLATIGGVRTEEEDATPADLLGTEVWVLNALHGIRPVIEWDGDTSFGIDRTRLSVWRGRLRALARQAVAG